MKATYNLTRDDLAALVEHHQRSSPTMQRQQIGCLIVGIGVMLVLPVGILLTTDEPVLQTAFNIWPLFLGPAFFGIFFVPYMRWRTRQVSDRMLDEGENRDFYGDCELEVADDAITETRPSGSTIRKWTAVERVDTTASHLFVYTSGVEAFVVPRRAFRAESEFNVFVDAIRERSHVDTRN